MSSPSRSTPRGSHAATRRRWAELIGEYERSALTQRAFCEQRGLVLSSFTRWRRRVLAERTDAPASSTAFVSVTLAAPSAASALPPPPTSPTLCVMLPGGVCIEGVSDDHLALVA